MRDFEQYLTNPAYAEVYGFNHKGLIYIENERDYAFWSDIVDSISPNKYEVKKSIIENNLSRGKRGLERLYSMANKKVLIAIDSDFDYTCPNRNEYSKHINDKYILHTHSYSRESVICNVESINDTINKLMLSKKASFDISEPIKKYSSICYESLIPFLFLLENRHCIANEKDFHNDLKVIETADLRRLNKDGKFNYKILEKISNNTKTRRFIYEKYINNHNLSAKYVEFKKHLLDLGVTPESAYRYISGHLVYDNFVIPILKEIKRRLINMEVENIKKSELSHSSSIRDAVRGVHNHFSEYCSEKSILNNCEKIKNDEVYKKIINKTRIAIEED
ncbi:hypothetical protein [Escherichia coli]|uniref:hypothetical protein n=1 Tax=Escherichia coli TaxID=562 RepID=UPI0035663D45